MDTSATRNSPRTLVELLSTTAAWQPDRPAVSDARTTLTYRELDEASDAVAALLEQRGVSAGDHVAVHLPRSVETVVSLLGVLKARAAYVAVDRRYPVSRRSLMFRESGAKTVLTDAADDPAAAQGVEVIDVRGVASLPRGGPRALAPAPEDAASVLFTSGSSGVPKALVLEHRNLVSFALNPALPALVPGDRTGQLSNVSFDAFHFEVWCTLAQGAEVVVLPPVTDLLASGIQQQLRERRITALLVPTAVVNHVAREDGDAFAPLRILHTGGDVLVPAACRAVLSGAFRGAFYNLYGPSEATTACTAHPVTQVGLDEVSVPIGRALEGTTLYVLDEVRRPVPAGEVGELHVSGPGVARGYLNQPELTELRFPPDPFTADGRRMYATGDLVRQRADGILEFVGRADDQVKIRGYRVEPGEVERALLRHPLVEDAAVLTAGPGQDRHLAALVVPRGALTMPDLRAFAQEQLPDFMVPSRLFPIPTVPANDHGKRDREALAELLAAAEQRADTGTLVSDTQHYLAGLWQELLDVESVGSSDDFFALGGNSLLAFRTERRVRQDLGVVVGFRAVLDHPVLADLAAVIDGAESAAETRAV
ncbi:non-ribosomal peptide synthetase [Streptomyces sioyaensis]|uniref:non-ribosomal peptide synthetase n=1 Tax=Streptomyces sioyaensis TaxID=67364 RepID=UPI0037A5833C